VNRPRLAGDGVVLTSGEPLAAAPPARLIAEGRRLQRTVAELKAAMRRQREQLQLAKTALVQLEATCRELGIQLIVQE
jgi:hypothetical protein